MGRNEPHGIYQAELNRFLQIRLIECRARFLLLLLCCLIHLFLAIFEGIGGLTGGS